MKCINLACGAAFIDSAYWLNLDFAQSSPAVKKANLLTRLPVDDNSATIVYSSHFVEHVPFSRVPSLLRECFRVLEPGGTLRLVLPDLENMAREYLRMRDLAEHDKADFVVLEMIDQCVRNQPGGQLGQLYSKLNKNRNNTKQSESLIKYIRERTGENILSTTPSFEMPRNWPLVRILNAIRDRIERLRIRLFVLCLPPAFRVQNISMTTVGERHQWLWDFYQIQKVLQSVGFTNISRQTANSSTINHFPFKPLDLDEENNPRKGVESMYVEARKPN